MSMNFSDEQLDAINALKAERDELAQFVIDIGGFWKHSKSDLKSFAKCVNAAFADSRELEKLKASASAEPKPWRAENVGAIHDEMVRSGFMSRFANESATPSAENRPAQDNVRDTQRLDWLAEEDEMGFFYNIDHISANINEGFNGFKTLREAIDAAIASAKEPK